MFFKTCHHLNAGRLKTSRLGSLHHLMNFHQRQREYGQIISFEKSRDYMYTKIFSEPQEDNLCKFQGYFTCRSIRKKCTSNFCINCVSVY